MNEFKEAKKRYEAIEIPAELSGRVQEAIKMSGDQRKKLDQEEFVGVKNKSKSMSKEMTRRGNFMKKNNIALKAAACVAIVVVGGFTVALNSSETFAATVSQLPVIESIAQVLTFRDYSYKDTEKEVTVEVPQIVTGEESSSSNVQEKNDYIEQINQMIQEKVEAYVKMAEENIADYKEAFLATGGTEEEFTSKEIKVDVSYDVKFETEDMVSFVLTANENWSSAYNVNYYYNLNLKDGKDITLKDLLGKDYIQLANKQILAQMEERMEADENVSYFGEDMDGFQTISDTTNFYINEAGNPVVVFAKYEIAPGFMGAQEFELVK